MLDRISSCIDQTSYDQNGFDALISAAIDNTLEPKKD